MKVQVPANELRNAEIEKVSLVKHGANRTPFRILKTEDVKESTMSTLTAQLSKLFSKAEAPAKIVAVFVRKSAAKNLFPVVKANGFTVEAASADLHGDVVVLKQDGFHPDTEGSIVQVTEDLAIGFDRVVKDFCSYHASSDFATTLSTQSFYPSTRMAMDALMETLWAAAGESKTNEEFIGKVDAASKSFAKHLAGLAKVLPVEVFKMEQQVLKSVFEPRSVATTAAATAPEIQKGDDVTKNVLKREAVAGDLAGLFDEPVQKSEAEVAAELAAADAAAAAEAAAADASAAEAAAIEAAVAATGAEDVKPEGAEAAAAAVAAPAAAVAAPVDAGALALAKALEGMTAALTNMQKSVDDRFAAQDAKLESLAKSTTEAVKKAENTAIAPSLRAEGTLQTMQGHQRLTKADEGDTSGVWKGLIPAFDRIEGVENA